MQGYILDKENANKLLIMKKRKVWWIKPVSIYFMCYVYIWSDELHYSCDSLYVWMRPIIQSSFAHCGTSLKHQLLECIQAKLGHCVSWPMSQCVCLFLTGYLRGSYWLFTEHKLLIECYHEEKPRQSNVGICIINLYYVITILLNKTQTGLTQSD